MNLEGVMLEVTIKATMPDGKVVTLEVPKMCGDLRVVARNVAEVDMGPLSAQNSLATPEWMMHVYVDGRPMAADATGTLWTVRGPE